jgi:hypothetical protein
MLVSLKTDVDRCIEWIDLGLGPRDVGSKLSPVGVVVAELKPNSLDFVPYRVPV